MAEHSLILGGLWSLVWWLATLISSEQVLGVGLQIALFGFLAFVLYENLSTSLKLNTAQGKARKNIRTIAKYLEYSLGFFVAAYLFGYASGATWLVPVSSSLSLIWIARFCGFCGFVLLAPPGYELLRIFSNPKLSINKILLPDVSQTLSAAFLLIIYAYIVWFELSKTTPMTLLRGIGLSIILLGALGVPLNFKEKKKLGLWSKRIIDTLVILPFFSLPALLILYQLILHHHL